MQKRLCLRASLTLVASTVVPLAGVAYGDPAQPSTASSSAPADTGGSLEEIVVVAQKRQENSQTVPISVTAVTADRAAKLGITDGQSLISLVPGLNFQRQSNSSIPFIRGIGTAVGQTGDEPSVAFYVDDVYIPAGAGSILNFNSIDRIEVLKGPQGTLFGRNATGGVVSVYTKDPTHDPHFDFSAGWANYDTFSESMYASGGFTDSLSANISLYDTDQKHGWGTNLSTGNPTYLQQDFGGRTKLLWQPDDATRGVLILDFDRTTTGQGVTYQPATGTAALYPFSPGGSFLPAGGSFYDTVDDVDPQAISKQRGVSLSLSHQFAPFTVKSITAYRRLDALQVFGYDPVPAVPRLGPILNVHIPTKDDTTTQEFQLISAANDKFNWVGGLFYFHDLAGYVPLHFDGIFLPQLAPTAKVFAESFGLQTTNSYAAYAQGTYAVASDTHVTGGLRYTIDKRELVSYSDIDGGPAIYAPNSPQSVTFKKFTYRLAIDHELTSDIMIYAAYNRGFKSGLFNQVVFPLQPIEPVVQPEVVDAYTGGFKSEFLNHSLRVNLEAFENNAKDLQLERYVAGSTQLSNAARARIYGADLDIDWVPLQNLTLSWSIEVEHGSYLSLPNGFVNDYNPGIGGNPTGHQANLAGNQTIQTPPFTSSFSAIYQVATPLGPMSVSASYFHGGDYYFDYDNGIGQGSPSSPDLDRQRKMNLLNASVDMPLQGGRYDVKLWGKNLTNNQYIAYGAETLFLTSWDAAPPRTYGVTFGAHF